MIFLLYYLKEDHSLNQMDYDGTPIIVVPNEVSTLAVLVVKELKIKEIAMTLINEEE